ncbi:MAG: hypothetical protein J2P50_13275, partial [Hyphomicrobiaceae bacterium]|nr:hypothetical protein [Hyphomicrobiaceae bacterium]
MTEAPARAGVRPPVLLGILAAGVIVAFVASLAIGPSGFGLRVGGQAARLILWDIRVPRTVLG